MATLIIGFKTEENIQNKTVMEFCAEIEVDFIAEDWSMTEEQFFLTHEAYAKEFGADALELLQDSVVLDVI